MSSSAGSFSTATCMSASSGMYFCTGSLGRISPSSIIIIAATPRIGFVDDIMMKIASRDIGSLASTSISPCALKCTTLPLRATAVTAP